MKLSDEVRRTLQDFGHETESLRHLPARRYDRTLFPTIGQYDWLSGKILYCLIRSLRPVRVIEVSTSSGYSSLFSAYALRANGSGKLETYEFSETAARAASANFSRFGVAGHVNLHVGDARKTACDLLQRRTRGEREVLFLDSEHTDSFARWYLDAFLPDAHPESLLQVHDVLPAHATVKCRPLEAVTGKESRWRMRAHAVLSRLLPRWTPDDRRRWVKPMPANAVLSSEARMVLEMSREIPADEQLFVHDLLAERNDADDHAYDARSVWRCDAQGNPSEWNESWWVRCGVLRARWKERVQ